MNEQLRTLQGLQAAIRAEIDGKEFYTRSARQTRNRLGARLFERLAEEEDGHRTRFEQIYESIRTEKGWPKTELKADRGHTLRSIFAETLESKVASKSHLPSELDAVKTAIEMEARSHDLYKRSAGAATHEPEKAFFELVAAEEYEHQLVLVDYLEYLRDPAAWFVKAEHHSIDGG